MPNFPKRFALLALFLAGACADAAHSAPPPADRFFYPTGIAVRTLPGGRTSLLVASSNFDLRYDSGTVLSVDPDASSGDHLALLGGARIGTFAGQLAVLDAATCPQWTQKSQKPLAVVPSRNDRTLARVQLNDDGSLFCTGGADDQGLARCQDPCAGPNPCALQLQADIPDPFGVTAVCRPEGGPVPAVRAFITHLRSPGHEGWLSVADLAAGDIGLIDVGPGETHASAYDPASGRLLITSRYVGTAYTPLRFFDAGLPPFPASTANLYNVVGGSDTRGVAVSSDGQRAYVLLRNPDALVVLDMREGFSGEPAQRVVQVAPLPVGPNELLAIPRAGQRDLVALTSSDGHALVLWDDELGEIAATMGQDATGFYQVGQQPFGLAAQQRGSLYRLYVGSFDRGYVTLVDVDPQNPRDVHRVRHIGKER